MLTNNPCPHPHARIYRHPFRNGSGYHLAELCPDCSTNVRGPGRWVPRAEAIARGLDPDALPLAPDRLATRGN